ncbi:hypothetical protein ACHAXA_005727 [Cyclostephanos tholiformis]|uniref:Uncharacterized protein n=1 Tax=Cyclostephanos tholiformis TaxID=382380 RepID=A0ABD3R400_9STRA
MIVGESSSCLPASIPRPTPSPSHARWKRDADVATAAVNTPTASTTPPLLSARRRANSSCATGQDLDHHDRRQPALSPRRRRDHPTSMTTTIRTTTMTITTDGTSSSDHTDVASSPRPAAASPDRPSPAPSIPMVNRIRAHTCPGSRLTFGSTDVGEGWCERAVDDVESGLRGHRVADVRDDFPRPIMPSGREQHQTDQYAVRGEVATSSSWAIPNSLNGPSFPATSQRGEGSSVAPPPAAISVPLLRRISSRRHRDMSLANHPCAMRTCMVLSLYALLAFAWDTDLRYRYHSADVNFGLGEYWHGGLARRADKIGREVPRGGGLFNDDGADDGGIVARLVEDAAAAAAPAGDEGRDDASSPHMSSTFGDRTPPDDSAIVATPSPSRENIGRRTFGEEGMVRPRPSLSHARSFFGIASPHRRGAQQRRRTESSSSTSWTLLDAFRAIAWMGFALPVVEAGIREVRRRRADFRSLRTIARRSPSRSFRAATNAHDL